MQKRRLAAIMFTDIAGYTALMGKDEKKAFDLLRKNREIHTSLISKYRGTLVKELGDGMLISFHLATNAVRCAIEIQQRCKRRDIPLKIGINEGEIVFEGTDVLGDGVNIASRLEESANSGEIIISGSVYRSVKNIANIKSRFIGEKSFKNVDESLKIYRVENEDPISESEVFKSDEVGLISWKSKLAKSIVRLSSGIIVIIGFIILFIVYSGSTIPFQERDWVVISDFENHTQEPIFDHSLNTAFMLSINQSRYLNVMPRKRIQENLKRMQKAVMEVIDEETGREIAIREGINICIVPNISRVGSRYILSAKIQETETGEILKSEVLYAEDQDHILDKLDQLSKKTRRDLGESRYEISNQSKPLSKVTTSSLDALKEFSLGIENHINLDFEKAKIHYENAIRIDSNFTSAKASLGNLLFERFDQEKGRIWLDEAIQSVDDLTDREKYGILAFYAVNVENDIDKGIQYTKMRIDLYPDDPIPKNNLGWYYQKKGMYIEAIEEYKKAINIDPYVMIPYSGLIWTYLENFGNLDSARVWSRQMINYDPENPWGYFYLGSVFVGMEELEKAADNFRRSVELDPKLMFSQYRLAHVYRLMDNYTKAVDVLQNILKIKPDEISAHYDMGVNYELAGAHDLAQNHFLKYLEKAKRWEKEFPQNPATYTSLGAGLFRIGEMEAGYQNMQKAIALDSSYYFQFATLLAIQDKKEEALTQLEKALKNGYRDQVWIKLHPDLYLLQKEVNFQQLMEDYFH